MAVFAIILDLITFGIGFAFIFVAIGHDANSGTECTSANLLCGKQVPLGTWVSFPSSCPSVDACELFGNTTYRNIVTLNDQIFGVGFALEASCVTPSNTLGASLQLQDATYSSATHTNTTNFVNLGGALLIDNSANNPCPGTLINTFTIPASISGAGVRSFIFRVVGNGGGGGAGDNPRFSSINLAMQHKVFNLVNTYATLITTTGFRASATLTLTPQTATSISYAWIASNSTIAGVAFQDGSGSCSIAVGFFSCTQDFVFGIAFAVAPNVVISPKTVGGILNIPLGYQPFFSTQVSTA